MTLDTNASGRAWGRCADGGFGAANMIGAATGVDDGFGAGTGSCIFETGEKGVSTVLEVAGARSEGEGVLHGLIHVVKLFLKRKSSCIVIFVPDK